jgi:hypothetical protein
MLRQRLANFSSLGRHQAKSIVVALCTAAFRSRAKDVTISRQDRCKEYFCNNRPVRLTSKKELMQIISTNVIKAAACLALAAASLGAHAADWRPIGKTDIGELSMDAESVQEKNGIRQAWSMWNFKEARNNSEATFPSLKSYQDQHFYNCKDQTMRLVQEIIYADNNGMGDKRDHSDALTNTVFAKPAEGSVAELMMKEVCTVDLVKPAAKPAAAKKKK